MLTRRKVRAVTLNCSGALWSRQYSRLEVAGGHLLGLRAVALALRGPPLQLLLRCSRDKRSGRFYRFAQLVDLSVDTGSHMRAISRRNKLHSRFQRQNTSHGFLDSLAQHGATARGFHDSVKCPLDQRCGLREEEQVIDGLNGTEEDIGCQAETRQGDHGEIVGNGDAFVAKFLPQETPDHAG